MDRLKARKNDERGAVAVMVALTMTLLVLTLAFVIDMGMTRSDIRNIQGMADIASMDLARQIDGQKTSLLTSKMDSQLAKTLSRNGASDLDLSYKMGKVNPTTGVFTVTGPDEVPNAVRVVVNGSHIRASMPNKTDTYSRQAITMGTPSSGSDCFTLGGWAATKGTTGENGINAFFAKVIEQSGQSGWYFGNKGGFNGFNYKGLLGESVNLTGVATRMGYTTIQEFRDANVNLKNFYSAVRQQAQSDYGAPNTVALMGIAISPATNMNPNLTVPMTIILGNNLAGNVYANSLDVFGGISMHLNNNASVNPNFGNSMGNVFSQGPTNITYNQGAHIHCAKPGDVVSTAGTNPQQTSMLLNGSLNPSGYATRLYSPGFVDSNINVSLGYVSLVAKIEPVELKMNSVTCDSTSKTAKFDLLKGDIDLSLGLDGGGTTYAGQNGVKANLTGYGPVSIDWGLPLSFRAYMDSAPSLNNTVTGTMANIDKPLYIPGNQAKWKVDVTQAVNSFSYFRVLRDGGQYLEYNLTAAQKVKLKTAIVEAYVKPLLDPTNPNGFFTGYINGALGFSGSSINGPSIIFSEKSLSCNGAGAKTKVQLVG